MLDVKSKDFWKIVKKKKLALNKSATFIATESTEIKYTYKFVCKAARVSE